MKRLLKGILSKNIFVPQRKLVLVSQGWRVSLTLWYVPLKIITFPIDVTPMEGKELGIRQNRGVVVFIYHNCRQRCDDVIICRRLLSLFSSSLFIR